MSFGLNVKNPEAMFFLCVFFLKLHHDTKALVGLAHSYAEGNGNCKNGLINWGLSHASGTSCTPSGTAIPETSSANGKSYCRK